MENIMEKFCLKWSDFETNIREYFGKLSEEHSYYDVTLATDDHYQIEAHKVILSAGSKFFNEILKNANHKNIFIKSERAVPHPGLNCVLSLRNLGIGLVRLRDQGP